MFAPKVAKPQTKATEGSLSRLAPHRSTLAGHRLGHDPVERALFLQRTIGNQATLEQKAAEGNTTPRKAPWLASWDFSKIPLFPPERASRAQPSFVPVATPIRGAIQAKLIVGQANDPLEHEADRVADQVMRMPTPMLPIGAAPPQVNRKCAACEEQEAKILHTKRTGEPVRSIAEAPSSVHAVLGSAGQRLDTATCAFFEPRFKHDFTRVRVHADARAAASAAEVGARAYTVGDDIVFGAGEYAPRTPEGQRLLAHEMVHVVQQSGGSAFFKRDDMSVASTVSDPMGAAFRPTATTARLVARQAAPAAPQNCVHGVAVNCRLANCSADQQTSAAADIARGLGYANAAVASLAANPLSGFTTRALDWYFGGHDATTVATVSQRMACIVTSLGSASARFGCDLNDPSDLAYTCASGAGFCGHLRRPICFTSRHFAQGPRNRAITAVHEASHLEGMSTGWHSSPPFGSGRGTPTTGTNPDIYQWEGRFLDMSPAQAVQNADSYALFAAAIGTQNVPSTRLVTLSAGGGAAISPSADPTWYFQGTAGVEFQHPRLRVFHPSLNVGFTLIGESISRDTKTPVSTSLLLSVLAGLRIGQSRRPGTGGGLELSLLGGPALSIGGVGAVAGVALGYRWHALDFSVGAGYAYDPARAAAGAGQTATIGGTFTIARY